MRSSCASEELDIRRSSRLTMMSMSNSVRWSALAFAARSSRNAGSPKSVDADKRQGFRILRIDEEAMFTVLHDMRDGAYSCRNHRCAASHVLEHAGRKSLRVRTANPDVERADEVRHVSLSAEERDDISESQ